MSSFEELQVWQRSKSLAVDVIRAVSDCTLYSLKDQIVRSAVSIASNIAEGAERKGGREFRNFLSYASGSCAELTTQIMILQELDGLSDQQAEAYISECREISKMLYGLRKSIKD